jgi:hypothetical protein
VFTVFFAVLIYSTTASTQERVPVFDSGQCLPRYVVESQPTLPKGIGSISSGGGIPIPPIAKGYEDIYKRFYNGRLIYNKGQPDEVVLPFSGLSNPLEGTFDLSQCGDAGKHLSISIGYPRQEKSANTHKIKVWIAPKFMIEKELSNTTQLLRPIFPEWTAPKSLLGMFCTWGAWDLKQNNYLIILEMENLSSIRASDRCGFNLVW